MLKHHEKAEVPDGWDTTAYTLSLASPIERDAARVNVLKCVTLFVEFTKDAHICAQVKSGGRFAQGGAWAVA